MTPSIRRSARFACLSLLTCLLAACGGGDGHSASATTPTTTVASNESAPGAQFIQSATFNAEGSANTLTVRARGTLAGDVGPLMTVLVDGVSIDSVEVRATTPTDYVFTVPTLHAGSKLDIVFSNDALVNGVDRNLYVVQLSNGRTAVAPTATNSSFDRGAGSLAFDGNDVVPGGSNLNVNGALRLVWPDANLTENITVRASGTPTDGVPPQMVVRVDGIVIGTADVNTTTPADFTFATPAFSAGSNVDVAFTNAGITNGVARTLNVHYLIAGTTVLRPTDTGVRFDAGSGLAAYDGSGVSAGLVTLATNGALRGTWPAANMTDSLTLRASGTLAAGVGPIVQVLADGVLLGTVEVRSTTPTDIKLAALPLKPGQRIEVRPTNLGTFNGQTRNFTVAYAISGTTVLQAPANATSLDAAWPEPTLTDSLNIRARSTLVAGVGSIMQLYVDGVMVGSTEVKSAAFADHRFAVPPMSAGRKVDVVFANDAFINGQDRNLYIAYLTTSNSVLLPTASGNVYDRGAGSAAFDGNDLLTATGNLNANGALRATWPAANITDTLTIRANATAAGGIGALMTLWVDGVAVSSVEVKSSAPVDYLMPTTAIRPGSNVAIAFSNRGNVDGTERTLNVLYAIAGSTFITPTTAGATYASGDLSAAWPQPNITDTLTVRAYTTVAGGVGAVMQVRVDNVQVGQLEVTATQPQDHAIGIPKLRPGSQVDVVFVNDALVNGVDRNLYVVQLTNGRTSLAPNTTNSIFDRGAGGLAFDGIDAVPGGSGLNVNGALRLVWPDPNLTESITVRASSTPADGVPAQMVVRVNGIVVGTSEVNTTTPADFTFAAPDYAAGSNVDVAFTNAGITNGVARTLNVHYLIAGTTVLRPTDASVRFDAGSGLAAYDGSGVSAGLVTLAANGALRGTWPAANMTDSITVRASGRPAVNVGPLMQLRIDGVVVGTAEVRATTPTDYSFAVLPLQPGSQIDVVYLNDTVVNGEDRDLNVHYLIAGKTSLLPTAAGVVYDLGSGAAAFDGANVEPGRTTLASNGALRASWPAPNMTESLTVHARGSLAGNVGPTMQLHVDGVLVGTANVQSTDFTDYSFAVPPLKPGSRVDVVFTNDAFINGQDRNLYVAYLIAGKTSVLPSAPGVMIDRGAGAAAFDGIDVFAGRESLSWTGALRFLWPDPNITDNITVRASGSLAGNVGPLMQLRVDGVFVSSVEVRTTTPTDYLMPVPPLRVGSKIDVVYSNDATVNGADRNLNVAYLMAGNTFMLPQAGDVRYDQGSGAAAFDGIDTLPGQAAMGVNGALRMRWPTPSLTDSITVRARGSLAGNVGPLMQLRVNGVILGTVEVRSTTGADYVFAVPPMLAGSKVDLAFLNDAIIDGQDRNLFIQYIKTNSATLAAVAPSVQQDNGSGEAAFDGLNTTASTGALSGVGALRFVVPASPTTDATLASQYAASRFLQQASFGPIPADIGRLTTLPFASWLTEQIAMPITSDFVNLVQRQYDRGDAWRPGGVSYNSATVAQVFWRTAANAPDQLRKRMAFALHQIFMVSQADSNLYTHSRAYAQYLDTLNQHALGNFRNLLEDMALSPAMGIYLSHMRNGKGDASTGRLPDENFAREVMQLFTIGLHELNNDGTLKLDSQSRPIETYGNDDVMALAKVFTGWSWAFADNLLTEQTFRWGNPDYSAANDQRIDLAKMKAYPGQHSPDEKRLFSGKTQARVIPANSSAQDSVRLALDTLFNHPNVGPFIGRQLIQRLVTSNPSPAYVARVAAAFNNNGNGVRGDLAAVVRTLLLDSEARGAPTAGFGKVREPVLRVAHWMRAFDATSSSGNYLMTWDFDPLLQPTLRAPSVFGYFRPGYVPPNTLMAADGATAPEFQIVSEPSTAAWVNTAEYMAGTGLGWTGTARDVSSALAPQLALAKAGDVDGLIQNLNLLLFAGRMSATLRNDLIDAVTGVRGNDAANHLNRARVAVFIALSSPEYLVQR